MIVDAFQNGLKQGPKAGKKSCFGIRVNDGPYVWETYDEVAERVQNFGSGLLECGLKPSTDAMVGVYAKNSPEWVMSELACAHYSLVLGAFAIYLCLFAVPLYDTLGPDAIKYIINQTKMSVVVVAEEKLHALLTAAPQCPSLRYVIKIGSLTAGNLFSIS